MTTPRGLIWVFGIAAVTLIDSDGRPNPERTAALRKLLEAKDCAVRARIYKEPA